MFIVLPYVANADQAEAEACAANLSGAGKQMYDAVVPALEPGDDVAKKLKATIKPLIKSGELSRSAARENGKAVKDCLDKLAV